MRQCGPCWFAICGWQIQHRFAAAQLGFWAPSSMSGREELYVATYRKGREKGWGGLYVDMYRSREEMNRGAGGRKYVWRGICVSFA